MEEFWGRNGREFWKVEVMGSGLGLGELRGGCRVDLVVEWGAEMVVVWVNSGRKLEVV